MPYGECVTRAGSGITCRNLVAYVGLSDAIDTLMTGVDAILGMDIIAAFSETQLRMDKFYSTLRGFIIAQLRNETE